MNSRLMSLLAGMLLAFSSVISPAQEPKTVGELLDKGGVQITGEALTKLLSGSLNSGVQHGTGAKFRNFMKEDGTLKGSAVVRDGGTVDVFGKWTVSDNGGLRSDLNNSRGARWSSVVFYYKLEDRLFGSLSTERNAELLERRIERP